MSISHDMHVIELPHENQRYAMFFAVATDEDIDGVVAVAKVSPWSYDNSAKPFVSGLHVYGALRRRGIARQLMRYIEKVCRFQKIQSLALYVHRNNVTARGLYEQEGYRAALDDGDDILFVKFLDYE
jgi:ribosomal protein S18 acetylase RimI-like enzyme